MFSTISSPTGWALFRACVALREILAVRRKRPVRRVRKTAAAIALVFGVSSGAGGSEEIPLPGNGRSEHNATLPFADDGIRPIQQLGTSLGPPAGELPMNLAQLRFGEAPVVDGALMEGRGWLDYAYFWQASALHYRPLYFEAPNLERYGYSAGHVLQPAVSAAHFFAAVPALPVRMALEPPWRRTYTLGHGRPGTAWQRRP